MKNLSLSKIIAALLICNVYLFTCGVAGTISDNNDYVGSDTENDDSGDDESRGMGTQDFLIGDLTDDSELSLMSNNVQIVDNVFGTPTLESRPIQQDFSPSRLMETLEITSSKDKDESDESDDEDDEDEEKPENNEDSENTGENNHSDNENTENNADHSDNSSSSETADDTESEPVDAETPTQPSTTTSNSSAANEILTVNNGGDIVSGKAVDIISRIVMNEIGGAFAPEAIKAQAVASYTFVKYHNTHNSYPSVLLRDEVPDSVRVLVNSVIGQAVYYDGEYIQAVYSASSAGCTASSKNVWGSDIPYLTSVYCELDALYDPNYGRTATFSSSDMKSRIYNSTGISLSGDPSDWFSIVDRTEGKYVGNMTIGGHSSYVDSDGDTVKITGRIFRERIMDFDIRSSAFDISYDSGSDEFTVTTYGYGHGVGLSENGANALATYWVWDYKQILEFYYPGTTVK